MYHVLMKVQRDRVREERGLSTPVLFHRCAVDVSKSRLLEEIKVQTGHSVMEEVPTEAGSSKYNSSQEV